MFLPINKQDMIHRGWAQPDFVYVIGDAYVDHPSFGHAIISRVLEAHGYKVAILSQPNWKDASSMREFGEPRLGFLVMSGNMDSMVNHYTVARRRRKQDAFTPDGVMGKRPDYALDAYCAAIRKAYPDAPIILGGIEASLRRLAHYDYWSDKVRQSVLLSSGADLLLYGMGEHSIVEVADALNSGLNIRDITFIDGTVYKTESLDSVYDAIVLPSFEKITSSKRTYAVSFQTQYENTDPFNAKRLVEPYEEDIFVVQNPPSKPLSTQEMDDVYALHYMRNYHPSYEALGGVPAIEEVKFSLVSNRGCFGACNFCALTFHQGRIVQTRSHENIVEEAKVIIADPNFKGYIHDVGGPTANFRHTACSKQENHGACTNKRCLFPQACQQLEVDHRDYLSLLRKLRKLPGVKKVFIRSGIRFDYLIYDKSDAFFEELVQHHISGQLKVAPEHIADPVLRRMGKPSNDVYQSFARKYKTLNKKYNKNQYLVPYLMSSHPGSTLKEAIALAEYIRDLGYMPEQVQDFYPTPSTVSTCMYYTGLDPRTLRPVYTPKTDHEKAMQRALIQYRNPKNYHLVLEALQRAGRTDLIGFDAHCLVHPPSNSASYTTTNSKQHNRGNANKKNSRNRRSRSSVHKNKRK